jgi:hypothetical protein
MRQRAKVEREGDRLVAGVAAGGNLDGLLGAFHETGERKTDSPLLRSLK